MVDIIDRIPLHGQYVSKTQILKAYKLISNEHISFISKFSEVRNTIVHKFENVNFSFEGYFSSLDKNQIKSWRNLLKNDRVQESTMTKLLDEKPKLAVWVKLLEIMATFLTKNFELRTNQKIEKAAQTTISELMGSTTSD